MFLLFRRRSFLTVVIISTLLVVGGFFMILNNQPATSPTLSWIMGEKTFLVDPGHGGTFPGRVNEDKVLEKEINLDIALKLDHIAHCKRIMRGLVDYNEIAGLNTGLHTAG